MSGTWCLTYLLVLVFLVKDNDGNGLDAVCQLLTLLHLEGIEERVALFRHLHGLDLCGVLRYWQHDG